MSQLEELLAVWLPRQRWFSGKGIPIRQIRVESRYTLVTSGPDGPDLNVLVLQAGQRGRSSRYQVLLGSRPPRSLPPDLARVAIGVCQVAGGRPRVVYDAAHDEELTRMLLERFAAPTGAEPSGKVRFRSLPGDSVRTGSSGRLLTGEQSNTSLVFGEDYILKTFRRLWPGPNPDLELNMALSGTPYVARPCGWIEADLAGHSTPTTLAMLQTYIPHATDGWVLATANVRALLEGPGDGRESAFTDEAAQLGRTTAEVHRSLARTLPTDVLTPTGAAEMADAMVERLAMASAEVPELAEHAPRVMEAYADFSEVDEPLPIQRIHGDYHLGQAIRTASGWVLLDFEGEPTVPVRDRQRLSSPLRDVAGMLRSFDYAAGYLLIGHPGDPGLEWAARSWARHNREAFCRGYADGGGADPEKHLAVLRAFEFDKAVYEVLYEARNRPNWLRVPLESIATAAAPPVPG
ncbi:MULTISPECIES: maltokinase N-terminal cap-like domain-containing protein [Nocardiopsis]|uniref:Maltokinase n=1 Tax=Nocardiopsis dassonvillei (strain ATCC 23218 / DSM 43111 / CIP 107115 / JCM 7437 / KCTC 9190 / NBRC 14626 / NCTC 10488 / NRRL B-5397 / IMRU 509) TaxID=446468 RepID=D7AUD8_NOCDD|nr:MULTISPECIES: phosphotransferase [Nocardiopsis]ADH65696.1 aminoglycoside phosphotransferase [Nocardiopsis dassonvillei subsp. dassonvillei DSM 43111]NKY80369.1 phosphotransferase [Nocardiopsis dassonvillei]VEI91716.1 Maltokinase [Nocardiopsis dassonvillei]